MDEAWRSDGDPDGAAERARQGGCHLLQDPAVKAHDLREAYIVGPDNYVWVPGIVVKT